MKALKAVIYRSLKSVLKQCEIGTPVLLILFLRRLPTALPKDVITKLKFLNVTLMAIKTLIALETVFYICFLINCQTTNKQSPNRRLLISSFPFVFVSTSPIAVHFSGMFFYSGRRFLQSLTVSRYCRLRQ